MKKERLSIDAFKVQSFVTSLENGNEMMGGLKADDSHTTIHTDPVLDPEHCDAVIADLRRAGL
jgi:hypothetical protein